MNKILKYKNKIVLINGLFISIAFTMKYFSNNIEGYQISMIIASIVGSIPIFIQAYQALKLKIISIDILVSIAIIGAFFIGEYSESAIVIFLFLFGSFLEKKTLEKTNSAIKKLVQLTPTTANKVTDNDIQKIAIDQLNIGDTILVKTGELIPVDGKIIDGLGIFNESTITGEAKPIQKKTENKVFAGTILDDGTVKIQVQNIGEDTTFGKIIELVEEAQDSQSDTQKLIDRFTKYYTPSVLILAIILFFITKDLVLAITVLVLGCPGALVIGVPVSIVSGIGNGAKNGVLIKGGDVIDGYSHVDTIVFDKTGTLTRGKPQVTDTFYYSKDHRTALDLLSNIESESTHPLAKAILEFNPEFKQLIISKTNVIKGRGIQALINQNQILVGNTELMTANNLLFDNEQKKTIKKLQKEGNSIVIMALNNRIELILGIHDQIRSDVSDTLIYLRKQGIRKLIMLTGDNQNTADLVGNELHLDEVHGNLLPEEKSNFIKKLQTNGHIVVFIGDGINDSPSLAIADIGIAMGNGADVAIETSDIVLTNSKFNHLGYSLNLVNKTTHNIKENIIISVGTVLLLLVGLILGYVHMASGMFIHEISILVVISNAMRLLSIKVSKN
ncbi:heavy metal translocating P-type ATPase [Lactobacillus terrae]|uniref:heavy metal translocating P-type ATPase n=1 Tax=Lactobacillus terrae TaxID=2269374 RepID=UPI000C1B7851|nr:heavy metal translocating P-type ATPase [Lactobacillus terrae]